MDKVLVIVGMGPNIGMGLALKFGSQGYRVGMVARNPEKLAAYVEELKGRGIDAVGALADVMDRDALVAAIGELRGKLGRIDVLEYSPLLNMHGLVDVLDLDVPSTLEQIEFQLLGAVACVRAVKDEMIARGDGALLFTTGASAYVPAPSHANGSIAVTALRQYALSLFIALQSRGVYVGSVSIARPFTKEEVADLYWDLMQQRDRFEIIVGDPRLMSVYDELVMAGLGVGYPARLVGELPKPKTERERHLHLVSMYHVSAVMGALAPDEEEQKRIETLVVERGGQVDAPLYGGNLDEVLPYPALR